MYKKGIFFAFLCIIIIFNHLFSQVDLVNKQVFKKEKEIELNFPGFSPMPFLSAINSKNEFIIVDNFGIRQILIFGQDGNLKGKIGKEGRNRGEFLFPEALYYNKSNHYYYIYDGDLFKILIFNASNQLENELKIPLFLEDLLITNDERIFCYSSGASERKDSKYSIFECGLKGNIINSFSKQSIYYNIATESKGGGIIIIDDSIFTITPYDYEIRKFSLTGKLLMKRKISSDYYSPIPEVFNYKEILDDFSKRKTFHNSFSHIRQIIKLNEYFGVIYSDKGEKRVFMDIFDSECNTLYKNILLPDHVGSSKGVLFEYNDFYFINKTNSNKYSIGIYKNEIFK